MANARALCSSEQPEAVMFDLHLMRKHLLTGLETGNLQSFPTMKKRRRGKRVTYECQIEVHCTCRMPETMSSMIQCEKCKIWFHLGTCVKAELKVRSRIRWTEEFSA